VLSLAWIVVALTVAVASSATAQTPPPTAASAHAEPDGVAALLVELQQLLLAGDAGAYRTLLDTSADRQRADAFASLMVRSGLTRATVRERDRTLLLNGGYRLVVDVFTEAGPKGRIDTWQLDVKAGAITDPDAANRWRITDQEPLTVVDGLHRLALSPDRQFAVRNLTLRGEDFTALLPSGLAFVAETDEGVTGAVLIGRGEMVFSPRPAAERTQVRLFAGRDELRTSFDSLFLRINPADISSRINEEALTPTRAGGRDLRRAESIFAEELPKSFGLDLSDLSRETWSLMPPYGDMLVEVRTRKHGTLTYARSSTEAEDITVFSRERQRNISLYSSNARLAARGEFFSEDAQRDFDIEHYDLDVEFIPEREWIEGTVRLRVRARTVLGTMTLRLAEPLGIRSIRSDRHGRLLSVRVRNQNGVIVNLPRTVERDGVMTLTVSYGGRLPPPPTDREALAVQELQFLQDMPNLRPERRLVYTTRSYWYPQSSVSDYATALLRLTVPSTFDVVASGEPSGDNPMAVPETVGQPPRQQFIYTAQQPVRYLSVLLSRLASVASTAVRRDASTAHAANRYDPSGAEPTATESIGVEGTAHDEVTLNIVANPRQVSKAEAFERKASQVLAFYGGLVGDLPYSSFTLALVDNETPGGHSPGYFALLHQPLPTTPYMWRNDPVAFENFDDFFLAHEVAHQYWGQAVGWKNYHEQWISEGFAQYFAALYALETQPGSFGGIIRQMRRTAMAQRGQGPVYLGYRLGHIRGQSRVFRALVYNKGAMVLHMLRRWVGDEAFFRGLRQFYWDFRFKKAGTDDVRAAFEAASGDSLERFFTRWIYEDDTPELIFSHTQSSGAPGDRETGPAGEVVLRVEQRGSVLSDVPVPVTLRYESGRTEEVVVRASERLTELRHPLAGSLRDVRVNEDEVLAGIRK
jgi:hypothetical protein